jgi:Protein of unknown function (DUF3300)
VNIMDIIRAAATPPRFRRRRDIVVCLLSSSFLLASFAQRLCAEEDAPSPQVPSHTQQTPDQLQQLVAPIALYPDSLVAQILAASTFPEQVVEADRWLQAHADLKGDALGQAVDAQPWDPSVKALTGFPSVLGNMDKNLSWTSSLGDAFYNQQQDVMDAVQVMRRRAQAAGNLRSTPQQTVDDQNSTIVIQPTSTEVVYVPAYDPWLAYGDPLVAWPGWYPYPGIWYAGPYLAFGAGFDIGFVAAFGWGWGEWGFDWRNRYPLYHHGRYYSRSNTFYNRNSYYRGGGERGVARDVQRGVSAGRAGDTGRPGEAGRPNDAGRPGEVGRPGGAERPADAERPDDAGRAGDDSRNAGESGDSRSSARPFDGDAEAARGYGEARDESAVRSSAFGEYDHGGDVRSFSSRGSASFGGGGGGPRGAAGGRR